MKQRKTKKLSQKEVQRLKIEHKRVWLKCTTCDNEVLVDEGVIAVKCHVCTAKLAPPPKILTSAKEKSDKPAGWRFMAEFVDKDGNVFHFGEEQPNLKGTKEPSNVDAIREEQKKKRKETKAKKERREKLKEERLAREYAKKQKAKKKAEEKKQKELDKKTDKKPVKKAAKPKESKNKNTNSAFKYEKFEEPRIATDREQIQQLIESESTFAEHLQRREISVESISKIARSSYAKIDPESGDVKSKRRGYKVSLQDGNVKIININVK